jgi:hypothetical protein
MYVQAWYGKVLAYLPAYNTRALHQAGTDSSLFLMHDTHLWGGYLVTTAPIYLQSVA